MGLRTGYIQDVNCPVDSVCLEENRVQRSRYSVFRLVLSFVSLFWEWRGSDICVSSIMLYMHMCTYICVLVYICVCICVVYICVCLCACLCISVSTVDPWTAQGLGELTSPHSVRSECNLQPPLSVQGSLVSTVLHLQVQLTMVPVVLQCLLLKKHVPVQFKLCCSRVNCVCVCVCTHSQH